MQYYLQTQMKLKTQRIPSVLTSQMPIATMYVWEYIIFEIQLNAQIHLTFLLLQNDDYSGTDITPFESYATPLDKDDCPIDEYVIFLDTMNSTCPISTILLIICIDVLYYIFFLSF